VAKERQKLVLDRMLELGFITQKEHQAAWVYPVRIHGIRSSHLAPYFTAYVQALLADKLGSQALRSGGYKIMTSLDLDLQRAAEDALVRQVRQLKRQRVSQAALVCIDPHSGEIKAMVGGMDFGESQFNRAVQAHRQPGSSFKPFVYLTALANGMTPETVVKDEPLSYAMSDGRQWKPQNYDRRFRGDISLSSALEQSINIVAVKLAEQFSPARVIETARQAGISSPMQPNLALSLGASEVTPLELCSAYGTLATGGKHTPPMAILRIEDNTGKVLMMAQPDLQETLNPSAVAALTTMMQGVVTRGTGRGANFGKPAAGKTGTTSDSRDAWFAGFTPDLATVVWVGNDDNSPMRGVTGATCAPIWGQFMRAATRSLPARGFPTAMPAEPSDMMAEPSDTAVQPIESLDQPAQGDTEAVQPQPAPTETTDDGLQELPPPGEQGLDIAPAPLN
jgi:penicillin-binding protein 1A